MAQIINQSHVTDLSSQPPIIVDSNLVTTIINIPPTTPSVIYKQSHFGFCFITLPPCGNAKFNWCCKKHRCQKQKSFEQTFKNCCKIKGWF